MLFLLSDRVVGPALALVHAVRSLGSLTRLYAAAAKVKAKRTLASPRTFVFLCPAEPLIQPNTSSIRFLTLILAA